MTTALGALHEAIWSAFEPRLQQIGLSMTDFQVMSAIHAARGMAAQIQIAAALGITAPSLSEAVRAMERSGLVQRKVTSADRRVRILGLTDKGDAMLRSAFRILESIEASMTEGLRERDHDVALVTIKRMLDAIEASDLLKTR